MATLAFQMKPSRKQRRSKRKPSETERLAQAIDLPVSQRRRGDLVAVDVAHYTEDDQRKSLRSGERQTVRRTPKVRELYNHGLLDKRELAACEWYVSQHEDEGRIKVAQWEAASPTSDKAYGHWPPERILEPRETLFQYARAGIHPIARMVFERVVLHHRPMGRLGLTFRTAVRQLMKRIEGRVQL